MSSSSAPGGEGRTALAAGVLCYTFWGVMPLYFRLLGGMGLGAWEMIGNRLAWSAPTALILVLAAGQGRQVLAVLRQPRTLGLLAISAMAIMTNWSLYVIAVDAGHIIEASLGYYINPLMIMAVGAIFFRERLTTLGKVAIGLTVVGVLVQALALGHPPFLALTLACSFTIYGVVRKQVKADAQTGLFIECAYLAPMGVAYLIWLQHMGKGHLLASPGTFALLIALGPGTAFPLALFAWVARRLPLTAVGFLQFISPTIGFIIGICMGEPLSWLGIVSFGFIWAGVAVYALGAWRATRRVVQAVEAAEA
jgi:chloramphenicol-sensitive protein RarD